MACSCFFCRIAASSNVVINVPYKVRQAFILSSIKGCTMDIDHACPLCGNTKCVSHWASVSRFLREKMFENQGPKGCRLQHCKDCDFYFFNLRPDDAEMQRFYQGYRGIEYQRQRERFEANYTEEFNRFLGTHPVEIGLLHVSCGIA